MADPAGNRQPVEREDNDEQDEQQRPQEIRDRQDESGRAVDRRLAGPAAPVGAGERHRPAERDGDRHGDQAELDGHRQAAEHQFHHVLAHRDRGAEIAAGQVLQIVDELERDALVQPVEPAQRGDVRVGGAGPDQHGDRIARHHAQQHEHDRRHAEQCRDRQKQPAEQEGPGHGSAASARSIRRRQERFGSPPLRPGASCRKNQPCHPGRPEGEPGSRAACADFRVGSGPRIAAALRPGWHCRGFCGGAGPAAIAHAEPANFHRQVYRAPTPSTSPGAGRSWRSGRGISGPS